MNIKDLKSINDMVVLLRTEDIDKIKKIPKHDLILELRIGEPEEQFIKDKLILIVAGTTIIKSKEEI